MSNQVAILNQLFRQTYSTRSVRLEETLANVMCLVTGCDESEGAVFAERKKRVFWNEIIRRMDEESRKGLFRTFDVVDPARFELSWFPIFSVADDRRIKNLKLRLVHRGALLNYIDDDAKVSSRDYEALGCVVANLSGASRWHLTPPGNEYGIDFVAIIPSFGRGHLFPHANKQLRIVGQSKKWNSKIKRDQIDLLANRIEDIRRRNERVLRILPAWFISSNGPLVGCMISHSGAQSGSHDIANDHGIVLGDSRDVVEIIALSKHWHVGGGIGEATRFLSDSVSRVFASS